MDDQLIIKGGGCRVYIYNFILITSKSDLNDTELNVSHFALVFMKIQLLNKMTVFFALGLLSLLGIIVSSIILTTRNGMNERLQGWVNLLWLPVPILIIIIDRICLKKYGVKKSNKIQLYILGALILLFILNLFRLQIQI
jgi:hypothetical protein